jgi:hypothetical protein
VWGHFLVRDSNKTHELLGSDFALIGVSAALFFSFVGLLKPNLFIFDSFFINPMGTRPTRACAKFHL